MLTIKLTNISIPLHYINNQKYKNKIIDKNKRLKLKICSEILQYFYCYSSNKYQIKEYHIHLMKI